MISNERPSPYERRSSTRGGQFGSHGPESNLRTEKITVERKTFIFSLKENTRGRFVRITEDVNGRRDHIIVPATGLADFARIVSEMAAMGEGEGIEQEPEQGGSDRQSDASHVGQESEGSMDESVRDPRPDEVPGE